MDEEQRKGYEVRVRRDGRFWLVEIPALDGATQARRLDEVEPMAREYIALVTDDEAPVDLDVHVELPDDVRALVAHVAELRAQADAMQRQAAAEAHDAAVRLKEAGLTMREVGRALGVSHQRAQQLVTLSVPVVASDSDVVWHEQDDSAFGELAAASRPLSH